MYYILEPEVAGGLGERSVVDRSVHPPRVFRLEYKFDGWLGDDLLEVFPCFIVTERLHSAIASSHLIGFSFDEVIVSKSETFQELYPNRELSKFYWLKVTGRHDIDDLFLSSDHRLSISKKGFDLLKGFAIQHCDVQVINA